MLGGKALSPYITTTQLLTTSLKFTPTKNILHYTQDCPADLADPSKARAQPSDPIAAAH